MEEIKAWVARALASFEKELSGGEGLEFRLPDITGPFLTPDDLLKVQALDEALRINLEPHVHFAFTADNPPKPYAYIPFDDLCEKLAPRVVAF